MKISNLLIATCSILFLMIGVDKFLPFMEPSCSLMNDIPVGIWKGLGVVEIIAGILIWLPKYRKFISGFFLAFMLFFIIYHLVENTYDIGGAVFMAVLLGFLVWDPKFLKSNKT